MEVEVEVEELLEAEVEFWLEKKKTTLTKNFGVVNLVECKFVRDEARRSHWVGVRGVVWRIS